VPRQLWRPLNLRREECQCNQIAFIALWEDAGCKAVETAAGSLRDLRVAEVTNMDIKVDNGKVTAFRTRVALSFKYETDAIRSCNWRLAINRSFGAA
jgi:flavin-binding protein dodecin